MSGLFPDSSLNDLAPTLAALPGEPRRAMDRLHELRFRFVQLSASQPGLKPRDLDHSARRDLVSTLRRCEIEIAGVDLWIPVEHFSDPSHVDRAVNAAVDAVIFAADLGRVPISLTLPSDTESQNAPANEATAAVIAACERYGVPLADHAVPPSKRPRHDLLGIGIDPVAWLASSGGFDAAQITSSMPRSILSARLGDLSRTGSRQPLAQPGGRLNLQEYRIALSAAGYGCPVVLDARQWNNPWQAVQVARQAWHDT